MKIDEKDEIWLVDFQFFSILLCHIQIDSSANGRGGGLKI